MTTKSVLLVAMLAMASSIGTAQNERPTSGRKVEITAKKCEFSPARIEVKVGETVELTASSTDAKHGLECKELAIKKFTFEPGKPATVVFTAARAGTFEFKCANFCGMGHGRMKGEIVVVP